MDVGRISPLGVTLVAGPDVRTVSIRLSGAVDIGGEPVLTDALAQLARSAPTLVVLDMLDVTFVCSTFTNFVAAVHVAVPDASIVLHNPSPMARLVLCVTGVGGLVSMRHGVR